MLPGRTEHSIQQVAALRSILYFLLEKLRKRCFFVPFAYSSQPEYSAMRNILKLYIRFYYKLYFQLHFFLYPVLACGSHPHDAPLDP